MHRGSSAFPAIAVDVAGLSAAVAITAGNAHSCALLASGGVRCWGSNTFGQVTGTPTTTPQLTPVAPLLSPALPAVVGIAAGDFHTCALQSNGRVRCWGTSGSGRLGDGSVADAVGVAPGGVHTCVLRVGGTAQCWGGNGSGQLGNGTFTSSTAPVTVQQLVGLTTRCCPLTVVSVLGDATGLVAAEAGNTHTCAVRVDGQPLCWGGNGSGQVGDGSTTNRNIAVAVPSFRFNVDPRVLLGRDGRVAEVTALVNCPAGQSVQVQVSLTQGESSGQGIGVGTCTGGLDRYEVTVPANGRGSFIPGSALAEADGIIRDGGHVVDTQHWTRQVEITSGQ
jgi:alpha-tubulin suppressor-like RCC1 family protein